MQDRSSLPSVRMARSLDQLDWMSSRLPPALLGEGELVDRAAGGAGAGGECGGDLLGAFTALEGGGDLGFEVERGRGFGGGRAGDHDRDLAARGLFGVAGGELAERAAG